MNGLVHQLKAASVIARTEGLGRLGVRLVLFARRRLGMSNQDQTAYERRKAAADAAFDHSGLETGGVQYLRNLNIIGDNAAHGTNHVASDPEDFNAAISAITANIRESYFIDLGSGKGRALLLAAKYPFLRIIGVEFAAELHQAAQKNIERLEGADVKRSRIELIHGDATTYDFPPVPIVLYLYNPFSAQIVLNTAERALASWQAAPRQFVVIYANPVHAEQFVKAGWHQTRREQGFAIFSPEM